MQKKKILVVVDMSNVYYCVRQNFNFRMLDYQKLWDHIETKGEIYRAIAYGSMSGEGSSGFRGILRKIGFQVKLKETRVYNAGTPDERKKADWDVGIAMDVVQILDFVELVVFVTADGDMIPCVEHIKSRGKQTYVIGSYINYDLKNAADSFLEIQEDFLQDKREDKRDENPQDNESFNTKLSDSKLGIPFDSASVSNRQE